MLAAGFLGMPTEWWHFDAPEGAGYALSNEPL
jgi:D-alanyl-D-alanine dipeptidase